MPVAPDQALPADQADTFVATDALDTQAPVGLDVPTPGGLDPAGASTLDKNPVGLDFGGWGVPTGLEGSGLPKPITPNTAGISVNPQSTSFRDRVVSLGMQYLGIPYVWGGTTPKGFDCSGLLQYLFAREGVSLPRISADQARHGQRIALNQLRPGDLVAWDENSRNVGADHIAMYIGNGQILESPHTGANSRVRKLGANEGAWGVALNLPGDR